METFYGEGPHHELYTAFAGLYFCWLFLRGIHVFSNLVPRGWSNVFGRIKSYTVLVGRNRFPFLWIIVSFRIFFLSVGVEMHRGVFSSTWRHPFTFRAFIGSRCRSPSACCCQSVAHLFAFTGIWLVPFAIGYIFN